MKKVLMFLLLMAAVGGGVAYYLWNKPHANYADKKADVVVTVDQILTAYQADENAANASYLNKVIEVTGPIQEVSKNDKGEQTIYIGADPMARVSCELDKFSEQPEGAFKEGETATFRGLCTGYLSDVQLAGCTYIKK